MNDLVFGKDKTKKIVSIDVDKGRVTTTFADGQVRYATHEYFTLWTRQLTDKHYPLEGDQEYKYFTKRENRSDWIGDIQWARKHYHEVFTIWNDVEQYMVKNGVTYYKGMEFDELKVLSFDIETTGLKHDINSKVLIITVSYKQNGEIRRKMFCYDEYDSQQKMIAAFCAFVKQYDPHIITGHNILGFDFPYLQFVFKGNLPLGRGSKRGYAEKRHREFRKDGSQSYTFNNYLIPGREVVDTFFLSLKYDVGRKYPNYKLKDIIKYEGLEKENRQYYDASKIRLVYQDPTEWEKIKQYAKEDADDSLNLFYLMSPAYFYYSQSVSKPFQEIILGATGSQINNIMIRAYLQQGHSIPKASKPEPYEGGISFGNAGIYEHVNKVDVASMYPSVILDEKLYDKVKDPNAYLYELTKYFTAERLENKGLFKQTGNRKYDDLQSAQKIVINSIYGFLGATGLSYNSPAIASRVTASARFHLQQGINWAERNGYTVVNADTDSFMYSTGTVLTADEFQRHLDEINANSPRLIVWDNDGRYTNVVIVKAKNYAMKDLNGKVTIKGSGLKSTMKETALKEFADLILNYLLNNQPTMTVSLYNKYVKEINSLTDMQRWSSKKTITKAILHPARTNEQRVYDACASRLSSGELKEGDKINLFFETDKVLRLQQDFAGVYHKDKLLEKLFKTVKIFDTVLDINKFPNYKLKRNQEWLSKII